MLFKCIYKNTCEVCKENVCLKWCDCEACMFFVDRKCIGEPYKGIDRGRWKSCRQGRRWREMYQIVRELNES